MMMKRKKSMLMAVLMMTVASMMSCTDAPQKPTSYVVEGILPDSTHHGKQVYMERYYDRKSMGVTHIEGDRFVFTGVADTADYCRIDIERGLYCNLILENGHIHIKMEYTVRSEIPPFPTGTAGNEEIARLSEFEEAFSSAHRKRMDSLRQVFPNRTDFEKEAQPFADTYLQTFRQKGNELFSRHHADAIGLWLLHSRYYQHMKLEEKIAALESMPAEVQKSQWIESLLPPLKQLQKTQPGMPYIDIKGKDVNGQPIALSDFIGKGNYVFIDMWSSWCVPCKQEIPHIAEAYRELKDKGLTVVGIFVWDDFEKLPPSVKELNITWPQIAAETPVRSDYGVNGIPEMILFAPDGTIVERGLNLRGKDMTQKLKEYMKIK